MPTGKAIAPTMAGGMRDSAVAVLDQKKLHITAVIIVNSID